MSISNNGSKEGVIATSVLTGGHKRTAEVISLEIKALAKEVGLEKLGFLTLTFKQSVFHGATATKMLKNFVTRVLVPRYGRGLIVTERSAKKAIHFHCVVTLKTDIRTGLNFQEIANQALPRNKRYQSASPALKAEWAFLRSPSVQKYGIGRTELLPIRSTAEGIARYVGSYIGKNVSQRLPEDKGSRLVRFFGYKPSDRTASTRHATNSARSWLWRQKLGRCAAEWGCKDMAEITRRFGPRWAYHGAETIIAYDLTAGEGVVYPSVKHLLADGWEQPYWLPDSAVEIGPMKTGDLATRWECLPENRLEALSLRGIPR